jgi:hypothetical protein
VGALKVFGAFLFVFAGSLPASIPAIEDRANNNCCGARYGEPTVAFVGGWLFVFHGDVVCSDSMRPCKHATNSMTLYRAVVTGFSGMVRWRMS